MAEAPQWRLGWEEPYGLVLRCLDPARGVGVVWYPATQWRWGYNLDAVSWYRSSPDSELRWVPLTPPSP